MSDQNHAEVMNDIKKLLPKLTDRELREFFIYVEGLQAGRAVSHSLMIESTKGGIRDWKKPRKRSACSLCHQSGHRAPNCPTVPKEAVTS